MCYCDFKTYLNIVINLELSLQGKDLVTVINTCAPSSSAKYEKVKQFYDDIERAMADCDIKYKIIIGDFNAKIGTKAKKKRRHQKHGSIWNRGCRVCLIDIAEEHKRIIANALFQKPNIDT